MLRKQTPDSNLDDVLIITYTTLYSRRSGLLKEAHRSKLEILKLSADTNENFWLSAGRDSTRRLEASSIKHRTKVAAFTP